MTNILHIDTAQTLASICISSEDQCLAYAESNDQKQHASWLHQAILKLLSDAKLNQKDLSAIAVTIGPGSYTGLRVGLSAAKGLCYALNIPLITLNTLKIIATAAIETSKNDDTLFFPMIDARRMEVFGAVYDASLNEKVAPASFILEENLLLKLNLEQPILFCGDGGKKAYEYYKLENTVYCSENGTALQMIKLAFNKYKKAEFADLFYSEPLYIKEFFFASSNPK